MINLIKHSDSSFALEGKLGFSSVNKIDKAAKDLLNFKNQINIDCKKLEHCDSAGIALLVNWNKSAKLNGTEITFTNFSEQMQSLVQLMAVSDIFVGDQHGN